MWQLNKCLTICLIFLNLKISSSQFLSADYNLFKHLSEFYQSYQFGALDTDDIGPLRGKVEYSKAECDEQMDYWMTALNRSELWSLKMADAWGKIPSGILNGNVFELGSFDECLAIKEKTDIGVIEGQYCLQPISISLPAELKTQNRVTLLGTPVSSMLNFGIGSCVPKTCSPQYTQMLVSVMLQQFNVTIMPLDPNLLCHTNDEIKLDAVDIVVTVLLSLIVLMMICSTLYDLYTNHYAMPRKEIGLAFSVYSNGVKLFSCRRSKSSEVMNCLNGIRVLSIVWIIFGHVYTMTVYGVTVNPTGLWEWVKSYHAMIILSGPLAVDTFFLLSGLLVTWNVFKELQKTNGKLNIPLMYFHRYLRLTPAYVAVILFAVSYYKYLGTGPFSIFVQKFVFTDNCADYWWSALLYIQNYYNPNTICIQHTWYLSVDMQLFLLSPIILIPLWKWRRYMIPVIATLILLSIGCTFATFYVNDFRLSFVAGAGVSDTEQMRKIYFTTHTRMGTWLIGVLLAYYLFAIRAKTFVLSRYTVAAGWILSIGTMLAIVFGQYEMQQPGYEENIIESSIYTSLYRIGWCLALAWIIFACVTGYGGYINSFLSMAIWLPFARLSYAMYLLHVVLQAMRIKAMKVGGYFNEWNVVQTFWGDFGTTITLSVFWVLAFESPVFALEKLLFSRPKKQQPAPSNESLNQLHSSNSSPLV